MDLELATTEDMLTELKRRQMHFVFVGDQNTNRAQGEIIYAYQGTSRRNLACMLRFVLKRLLQQGSDDLSERTRLNGSGPDSSVSNRTVRCAPR